MPRRPRLSLPGLLLDAAEGYALWDAQGELVDYNSQFQQICGGGDAAANEADFISGECHSTFDTSIIPPRGVFAGEVIETIIELESPAGLLFELAAWPVSNAEGTLQAVMGRVRPHHEKQRPGDDYPSLYWGRRLQEELILRRQSQRPAGLENLVGFGPAHEQLLRRVKAAIQARCDVVIAGETGTGRHHVARLIHNRRQAGKTERAPLIPLDPTSLPAEILARDFLIARPESLSQMESAAFTPKWRVPGGSTILIEDLARLQPELQNLIGQAEENVRLIGLISHADGLTELQPTFRSRVETMIIEIKPLRERIEEIPLLAQAILQRLPLKTEHRRDGFTPAAIERLQMHDWPGNWRELERVVKEIAEKPGSPLISADEIPASIQGSYAGAWMNTAKPASSDRLEEALDQTRRTAVEQALKQFGANKAAAARALGVSRPKLYRMIAELGLE